MKLAEPDRGLGASDTYFSLVSLLMSDSSKNFQSPCKLAGEKMPKIKLVASSAGAISHEAFKRMVPLKPLSLGARHADQILYFLLKVAALEVVRRFSRARCPFIWRAVQALQMLGYPPFKWIQRWEPFRMIVKGAQKLSRPLLFLSIATAFSHQPEECTTVDSVDDDDSQPDSESPSRPSTSDMMVCDESSKPIVSENWLVQLFAELEKQGISLPERINEDELHRFYTAANGDLSCLLSSLKKTIRWRETYYILSSEELEMWSNLVFWHGFDVKLRPCLVIRLGLACSTLVPHDRPRFAQAVVSQIEHGVLHLINTDDPRITVLVDCEGISPLRFPMQMTRSFSSLVQDHYPNRLATLFVIRLPPVVRVIAQTLIQVLKPITRKKLVIVGDTYQTVISEFLQILPAFLGGKCTCSKCGIPPVGHTRRKYIDIVGRDPDVNTLNNEPSLDASPITELHFGGGCEHVLRASIIAILMLWILVAFLAGVYYPDSLASLPL